MTDEKRTPVVPRPRLQAVTEEPPSHLGNGDTRADPPPHETFEQRTERYLLEMHGMVHSIATEQSLQRKEIQLIKADVAVVRVVQQQHGLGLPPPRPRAPSFSDMSMDDGDEIITQNGTRKFAYSDEQLRAKMRKEYLEMQDHDKLVADASITRSVKTRGTTMVWGIVGLAITSILTALIVAAKAYIDSFFKGTHL